MFNSRGWSIQEGFLYSYLILKLINKLTNPIPLTWIKGELEEIPDIDELENNELLVDDI